MVIKSFHDFINESTEYDTLTGFSKIVYPLLFSPLVYGAIDLIIDMITPNNKHIKTYADMLDFFNQKYYNALEYRDDENYINIEKINIRIDFEKKSNNYRDFLINYSKSDKDILCTFKYIGNNKYEIFKPLSIKIIYQNPINDKLQLGLFNIHESTIYINLTAILFELSRKSNSFDVVRNDFETFARHIFYHELKHAFDYFNNSDVFSNNNHNNYSDYANADYEIEAETFAWFNKNRHRFKYHTIDDLLSNFEKTNIFYKHYSEENKEKARNILKKEFEDIK